MGGELTWGQGSLVRLQDAADRFDRPLVAALCACLVAAVRTEASAVTDDDARRVLETLRRKRYFRLLQGVADALLMSGRDTPRNRRLYAQALVDQGALAAALNVVAPLVSDCTDSQETREAAGLVGRAYKQQYLAATAADLSRRAGYLAEALSAYYRVYTSGGGRDVWHGINAVALLHRAASDGVPLNDFPEPETAATTLAEQMLSAVEDALGDGHWRAATALEACLALGRYDEGRSWLEQYVGTPDVDAFELAGTLRQLVEVWRLRTDSEPGATLLPLLKSELLRREGGQVDLSSAELPRVMASLHATVELQGRGFTSLEWMERGLLRCRGVARVEDAWGGGVGTGFVVNGADFRRGWPSAVLLTNAHVVPGTLDPRRSRVTFYGAGAAEGRSTGPTEVLWCSPVEELDATFLRLKEVPRGVSPSPVPRTPRRPGSERPSRAFVIGHPGRSGPPMFSLENNRVLDCDDKYLHYSAATAHGSSGSPVYDDEWNLIALHHRGGDAMRRLDGRPGTYRANEGIWARRIQDAVSEDR